MFPRRLVSLRADIGWQARSPDLSMCDFFLWGYLKDEVFRHRPHTIEEIKQKISEEVEAIPVEKCRKSYGSFRDRLQQCIDADGCHLGDIIFKNNFLKLGLNTDFNFKKKFFSKFYCSLFIAHQNSSVGSAASCIITKLNFIKINNNKLVFNYVLLL